MKLPLRFSGLLVLFLFFTTEIFSQTEFPSQLPTFFLSEKSLAELPLKDTPQWESIEALYLQNKSQFELIQDKYRPEIFGEMNRMETKEKAIFPFMPVWSPQQNFKVGVRQDFSQGVNLAASLSADSRSAKTPDSRYEGISTNTLQVDFEVDLWKNLFGRLNQAQVEGALFNFKKAELEQDVQKKAFLLGLRRIYWNLVANNERLKVFEGLKKISQAQLRDAQLRKNAGVADDGEVARYEAQVATREGSRLYHLYQHEQILKELKRHVPALRGQSVLLSDYNLNQNIETVLQCLGTIGAITGIPYEYTQYDEINELLRQNEKEQLKDSSSYGDIDLKFIGSVKTTGVSSENKGGGRVEGSMGESFRDWQEKNRLGYSAGIQVTIPLGFENTKTTQELLVKKRVSAQINKNDSDLISTHQQLIKTISLLTDVIRTQRQNSVALEKRLKVQNRKFQEARVSVNDLISDQDALLNSHLSTISTQLEIINTLFDYLTIFTQTPCEFNRI
jgi:hypothetical protein